MEDISIDSCKFSKHYLINTRIVFYQHFMTKQEDFLISNLSRKKKILKGVELSFLN